MKRTICVLTALLACATGTTITGELAFDRSELILSETDGMTVVSLPEHGMTWEVGAPSLPVATASLVIPQGVEVVGVQLLRYETEPVEGEYDVYPVQEPQPVSAPEKSSFTPPDPEYYGSAEYPGQIVVAGKQGLMFGYNIASVVVAPVQYVAGERKLVFHPRVEFSLELAPNDEYRKTDLNRGDAARARIEADLAEIVLNPEDLRGYAP